MLRFTTLALAATLALGASPFALCAAANDDLSALLALEEDGPKDSPKDGPKDGPRHREGPGGAGPRDGRPKPEGNAREHLRERLMAGLFQGITLDDAQKAAIEKLHKENAEKNQAFMKEHKEELKAFRETLEKWHKEHKADFEAAYKAIRQARMNKDEDAAKKAQESLKALLESRPKMPEALKAGLPEPRQIARQIRAILHPDQTAKFDANVKELEERRKKLEEGGFPGGPRGQNNRGGEGKGGEGRPPRRGGPVRGPQDGNKQAE